MMGAVGSRRVAKETPVGERRVERLRELVAGLSDERGDRRIKVGHERDHVDYRLRRKTGHSGGAKVVGLHPLEQRCEPLSLRFEGRPPHGVVVNELNRRVTTTGPCEVFGCGGSTIQ